MIKPASKAFVALALIVLAGTAFFSSLLSDVHNKPSLLLVLGQSNAQGRTSTSALPPDLVKLAGEIKIHEPLRIINKGGKNVLAISIDPVRPADLDHFGPEIGLMETLRIHKNGGFTIVKVALSGTSLYDWYPDWIGKVSPSSAKGPKGWLLKIVEDTLKKIDPDGSSKLAGIVWMQGERDAREYALADVYENNLQGLLLQLRSMAGTENLPVAVGLINPSEDRGYPYAETVREAQRRVAGKLENTLLVNTNGISKKIDELHYDGPGQLELGRRFATALLELGIEP